MNDQSTCAACGSEASPFDICGDDFWPSDIAGLYVCATCCNAEWAPWTNEALLATIRARLEPKHECAACGNSGPVSHWFDVALCGGCCDLWGRDKRLGEAGIREWLAERRQAQNEDSPACAACGEPAVPCPEAKSHWTDVWTVDQGEELGHAYLCAIHWTWPIIEAAPLIRARRRAQANEEPVCAVCTHPDPEMTLKERWGEVAGERVCERCFNNMPPVAMVQAILDRRQRAQSSETSETPTPEVAMRDEESAEYDHYCPPGPVEQSETPLQLARRMLGPEWAKIAEGDVYRFVAPDRVTLSPCDWAFFRHDSAIPYVRKQCEIALARYRERQQAWHQSGCRCSSCKQASDPDPNYIAVGDFTPGPAIVWLEATPTYCSDCRAAAELNLGLCAYCIHRSSPVEANPVPLDDRITAARAAIEAETTTVRYRHDWDADDSEISI